MNASEPCPCGSTFAYGHCCQPYHLGKAMPATAEQLMRSRYAAYALQLSPYIVLTTHSSKLQANLQSQVQSWMEVAEFKRLEVLGKENGGKDEENGRVHFRAWYKEYGQLKALQEDSAFQRENGAWRYVDGRHGGTAPRIGRNDACPCGSGKKYKKCCAA